MAISQDYTYRLLNAWQRWNMVSPWLFNQIVGNGIYAQLDQSGAGIFVEPDRDVIAQSILLAYPQALQHLRTFHRPEFTQETIHLDSRRPISRQYVETRFSHLHAIGKRTATLIQANVAITYSDSDDDSIDDRATLSVSTALTDADEIQVFFRVADGAPEAADRRYQIEPLRVTLSGGVATITGHRSLFVKPAIWRKPYTVPYFNSSDKNAGSTTDPASFVTQVDVYRVYANPDNAVEFRVAEHCSCGYSLEYGAANITDKRLGQVELCGPSVCMCGGYYSTVELYYQAGIPLTLERTPDPSLEKAFIRLANAKMPRVPQNLGPSATQLWSFDASVYPEGEGSPLYNNSPFGPRVGDIEAWLIMSQYVVGAGGASGARS